MTPGRLKVTIRHHLFDRALQILRGYQGRSLEESVLLERAPRDPQLSRILLSLIVFAAILLAGCSEPAKLRIVPQVGPANPQRLAFHPSNSNLLLVVEKAGAVAVWDVTDPARPAVKLILNTRATDARFLADGRIVTAERDGTVRIWRLDGSADREPLKAHSGRVTAIAVRQNAILSGGADGAIRLWNSDGSKRMEVSAHKGDVLSLVFSPRDGSFASAGRDGNIRVWGPDGKLVRDFLLQEGGPANDISISFSRQGDLLAAAGSVLGAEGPPGFRVKGLTVAKQWHLDRPEVQILAARGSSVAFSPKLDLLATGGTELQLWSRNGSRYGASLSSGLGSFTSLAFSPHGDVLASIHNRQVQLWNLDASLRSHFSVNPSGEDYSRSISLPAPTSAWRLWPRLVTELAFSRKGALAAVDGRGVVTLATNHFEDKNALIVGGGPIWAIAFSNHSNLRATFESAFVRICSETQAGPCTVVKHSNITSFAFGGPRDLLATSDKDNEIQLWSSGGHPRGRPFRTEGSVEAVAFSPTRDLLATISGQKLELWNLDGTHAVPPIELEDDSTKVVAFSRQGNLLATGGSSGRIQLWGTDGSRRGAPMKHGRSSVNDIAFSMREDLLVSLSEDGSIRFWNLDGSSRGAVLRLPSSGYSTSRHLALSPTEDLLAVSDRSEIYLWDLGGSPRGEPLGLARSGWVADVSPQPLLFAGGTSDDELKMWSLTETPSIGRPLNAEGATAIKFSPTGDRTASWGSGRSIQLWRSDGSGIGGPLQGGRDFKPNLVAISRDGKVVSTRSPAGFGPGSDSWIYTWNPGGVLQSKYRISSSEIVSLTVSAEGNDVAVGGWRYQSSKLRGLLLVVGPSGRTWVAPEAVGPVWAVAFASRGRILASAGQDGAVRLWRPATTQGDWEPDGPPLRGDTRVRSVAFSSDDDLLAAGGEDGVLRLWNLRTKALRELTIGYEIKRVGFLAHSVWVVADNGQIFFASLEPRLQAVVTLDHDGFVVTTNAGWYTGEGDIAERALLFRGASLDPLPLSIRSTRYSIEEVRAAILGSRSWWLSLKSIVIQVFRSIHGLYNGLPWYLKPAIWPTTLYLVLLIIVATVWIFRPAVVARWSMASRPAAEPPPWELAVKTIALVRWLGQTQRSLNHWLTAHNTELAARCFDQMEAVQKRRQYVDLGNREDLDRWLEALKSDHHDACWISGAGGCGKSTLAFQMAELSKGLNHNRSVLPILLDRDWAIPILDYIAGSLRVENRQPTPTMVEKLASSGRLVLVLDGLSERRVADAAHQALEIVQKGTFRHLIVTSREDSPEPKSVRPVQVGVLDSPRLKSFVAEYTPADEVEAALRDLETLTGGRPISPLFARLTLELRRAGYSIPDSYPHLVQEYVDRLRPRGPDALRQDDFLRAARLTAFACVEDDLAPRQVSSEYLRGVLKSQTLAFSAEMDATEVQAASVLDQLVQSGLLETVIDRAVKQVRFAYDVIAEYLAAMHAVSKGPETLAALQERLKGREGGLAEALERVDEARAAA